MTSTNNMNRENKAIDMQKSSRFYTKLYLVVRLYGGDLVAT